MSLQLLQPMAFGGACFFLVVLELLTQKQPQNFPWIDFSNINEVTEWPEKEETIEDLEKRIEIFKKYVNGRRETNIAVVSHSSYIGQMIHGKMGKEEKELKHCYPYICKL